MSNFKPISTSATAAHRIGAVSALSGVPVPTLRVWEIRYATFNPNLSAGGQRLYSDDDVLRATMLKRLTEQGHAISSIANHDATRLNTLLQQQNASHRREIAKSVEIQTVSAVVVGLALAARLASERFKKVFSATSFTSRIFFQTWMLRWPPRCACSPSSCWCGSIRCTPWCRWICTV